MSRMGSGSRVVEVIAPGTGAAARRIRSRGVPGAVTGRSAKTNVEHIVEGNVKGLAIKDVAERTGIAAGTIRMWEQRYGFPEPERTTAGYRLYSEDDVEALRRVLALRERGLSVPAAVDRVRGADMATDRPSLFGALSGGDQPVGSQILDQADAARDLARDRGRGDVARGVAASSFGSFQRERNYRAVEHRYRAMARTADAVVVFADFERLGADGAIAEVPARGRRRARQRVGRRHRRPRLQRVPARLGAAALGRARARRRADLRDDLDARPAHGAARGGGRRGAGAPRRRRAGRARSSGCCPSARWRWSIPRRA